jgi:predicted ferric reductase
MFDRRARRRDTGRVSATRRRATGWALGLLAVGNAGVVVSLWWSSGGVQDVHDIASLLTGLGRIAGLLGAYLALVELLLLARIRALERLISFDRLTAWHRRNGTACLALLLAHAVLITAGYTLGDRISLLAEVGRLVTGYPGVITAITGLALLVGVVVSSAVIVRRRLR